MPIDNGVRRMPDALRLALRSFRNGTGCIECDQPVSESLHGVIILCNCGKAAGLCQACFARNLDRIEEALQASG
jgi:hypothetical protein